MTPEEHNAKNSELSQGIKALSPPPFFEPLLTTRSLLRSLHFRRV